MQKLRTANFSLWCDFVERDFLESGFVSLIEAKVIQGATSNPAIFKSAVLGSPAYAEQKSALMGKPAKEVYEALACTDIALAADKLQPLYAQGEDGFISIEVDPNLSNDAGGTVDEGKRLFATIGKPNVMIKVPATPAGYEAMEALMGEGINVNATLIFSKAQAKGCLDAMQRGLAKCQSTKKPSGVISIFVSRFDRKLDPILEKAGVEVGLVGIYNATDIYHMIEGAGCKEVRTLFASTGVKGDSYPKDYYITELLYPNAVNTAPLETIEAYVANGTFVLKTPTSQETLDAYFAKIAQAGVNMDTVCNELLDEGLVAFEEAFAQMMDALA